MHREMICRPSFSYLNLSEQTLNCLGQRRLTVQEPGPELFRGSMFSSRDVAQEAAPQGEQPKSNPEHRTRNTKQRSTSLKYFASVARVLASATALFWVGCAKPDQSKPPPPEVVVVQVKQRDVPIWKEWIGTLEGLVNAQIKPQVTGYLLRQTYQEGSFVKKGQLLFEIDPRTFQAALDQTKGQLANAEQQLAQAEANQVKAQLDVGSLHSARQRAGGNPAGSRQCGADQSRRSGCSPGGQSSNQCGEGPGGCGSAQSELYQNCLAN